MNLTEVSDYLEGTCLSVDAAIEHFELNIDVEDLEDALLDVGLERCSGCGWWMESYELVDDDSEVVGCIQCREKK